MSFSFLLSPDPSDPRLSKEIVGTDETGTETRTNVITERPLTLYLNSHEIITMMTIGDHPDLLALGYLLNQNILRATDSVQSVDYDDELGVVVVRTSSQTDFESKQHKRIKTSGCGQGTIFGDVIDAFDTYTLSSESTIRSSWLLRLTHRINTTPSLYLSAGAIHGCVLCREDTPLVYMEDVGRHNAVDKIAGWMFQNEESGSDKIFYTTGRLTSEMVIKTVMMQIPILVSRSGFTAWGVELARQAGLTLIGRARGKRFVVLSGNERVIYDTSTSKDTD